MSKLDVNAFIASRYVYSFLFNLKLRFTIFLRIKVFLFCLDWRLTENSICFLDLLNINVFSLVDFHFICEHCLIKHISAFKFIQTLILWLCPLLLGRRNIDWYFFWNFRCRIELWVIHCWLSWWIKFHIKIWWFSGKSF